MRIYIFKSQTRKGLQAFAGDLAGSRLPQSHGPWTATGAIGPDNPPPYKFSRDAIEEASTPRDFSSGAWSRKLKTAPDGKTGAASAPRPYFPQCAFLHNALMLFTCALDAIFELPPIVRQLFGHFVGSARHIATHCAHDVHSLANLEFMRRHRISRMRPGPRALALT